LLAQVQTIPYQACLSFDQHPRFEKLSSSRSNFLLKFWTHHADKFINALGNFQVVVRLAGRGLNGKLLGDTTVD
jgi:hypothetical protein